MKLWLVFIFLLGVVLSFGGCKKETIPQNKMDPRLKSLVEAPASATASETKFVPIFGTTTQPIDDSLRRKIEKTGARVGTVGGEIFTADVPLTAIQKLVQMKEIKYLKLSEKAKPVK